MKHCCLKFQGAVSVDRSMAINIRIVKIKGSPLFDIINDGQPYKFWMTTGYSIGQDVTKSQISYCPFCGTSLHDFYNKDEYVNEDLNALL